MPYLVRIFGHPGQIRDGVKHTDPMLEMIPDEPVPFRNMPRGFHLREEDALRLAGKPKMFDVIEIDEAEFKRRAKARVVTNQDRIDEFRKAEEHAQRVAEEQRKRELAQQEARLEAEVERQLPIFKRLFARVTGQPL